MILFCLMYLYHHAPTIPQLWFFPSHSLAAYPSLCFTITKEKQIIIIINVNFAYIKPPPAAKGVKPFIITTQHQQGSATLDVILCRFRTESTLWNWDWVGLMLDEDGPLALGHERLSSFMLQCGVHVCVYMSIKLFVIMHRYERDHLNWMRADND